MNVRLPPVVGGIRAADHDVPRVRPCAARDVRTGRGPCGARPARPYQRSCASGHDRVVWLCDPHVWVLSQAPGMCAECLDNGGQVAARFEPLMEALLWFSACRQLRPTRS